MPQYLLSVWHDEPYDDVDFSLTRGPAPDRPGRRLQRRAQSGRGVGVRRADCARRRRPPSSAPPGGDVSMTDGPYAETKEQMGGFWIIEAADLDAALDWAAQGRGGLRRTGRGPTRRKMTDALDAVFRREAGRCTATLIRVLGDIDLAEDAVAEAFAIAAERWPVHGVPPNPGGWITTTARNRAIDRLRRESTRTDRYLAAHRLHDRRHGTRRHDPELDDLDAFVDVVPDDQLRLMFLCCHPALAADAQVALTLRLLGGLDTARDRPRPSSCPKRRWRSGSCGPSASCATTTRPTASRAPPSCPTGCAPCSPTVYLIFTEGHTATTGRRARAASTSRARRSASDGCSSSSCPTSPRPSASSR